MLIFLLAAAMRIWYLLDFSALPLFSQVCGPDVSEYFSEAQKIRSGHWLPQDVSIHAPLYPYVLSFFLEISGGRLPETRMIHSLFFALLTLMPVFLMLRKRTKGISSPMRFLPYAAVLILGLYPPLVICQSEFFSENLMMVLLLFSLLCFTSRRCCADGLAGVFGALALLAHPGCIFYIPFGCLYAGFRFPRGRNRARAAVKRSCAFLLGAVLTIAPVCLYNSLLAKRLILIQDNSMFNLVLGNSPESTGTCRIPPGVQWNSEFEKANRQAAAQGISVDAYYRNAFFHYVTARPFHYLKMLLKKAAMAFHSREFTTWSDAVSLGQIFWHRCMYQNWFLLILLLGGPVLLTGIFRRPFRRFMGLELLLFAAVFAGQVFFLTAGRYRMPLVIPLSVFSGYFLCRPKHFLGTARKTAGTLTAMIVLFMVAVYPHAVPHQPEMDYARSLLASAYIQAGNPAEAVKIYGESDATGECFPERKLSILGQAWFALGDLKRSGEYYREFLARYPGQPEGYLNYASVLSDSARSSEAEILLRKALKMHPGKRILADIEYNLGEIAQRKGMMSEAEKHYLAALSAVPFHRKALNNLGTVYIRCKSPGKAVPLFERALLLEPENVRLQVNLAISLAMSGRESEARKTAEAALRRDPSCVPAQNLLKMLP